MTGGVFALSELAAPLDDYLKLTVVVPNLLDVCETGSAPVMRLALSGIQGAIKATSELPPDLEGYFDRYLRDKLRLLIVRNTDLPVHMVFAEFAPPLCVECTRLESGSLLSFASAFTNIFDPRHLPVFNVFVGAMKAARPTGGFPLLNAFFSFLSAALNFETERQTEDFKRGTVSIFLEFYGNCADSQIKRYQEHAQTFLFPICDHLLNCQASLTLQAMIYELFEAVFRKSLLPAACFYEMAGHITKTRRSSSPEVIFWIERLNAIGPPRVAQCQLLSPCPSSFPRTQSRIIPELNFDDRTGGSALMEFGYFAENNFTSQFLAAYHLGRCSISHIAHPTESELLLVDSTNRLHFVSLDQANGRLNELQTSLQKDPISACISLTNEPGFALGFANGVVNHWDAKTHRVAQTCAVPSKNAVVAMAHLSGPSILAAFSDNSIVRYDVREPASAKKAAEPFFTPRSFSSPIAKLCAWPSGNFVGVGLKEGIVFVLDLRTGAPLALSLTVPVADLLPVASDAGLSFLAASPAIAELKTLPRFSSRTKQGTTRVYSHGAPIRLAIPHEGGAVVVDDAGASFVHCQEQAPLLRLFEKATAPLEVRTDKSAVIIQPTKQHGLSVHQHTARITCGGTMGDSFVTCDEIGSLHVWNFKPVRRSRTVSEVGRHGSARPS
jgi:hypothetical protein